MNGQNEKIQKIIGELCEFDSNFRQYESQLYSIIETMLKSKPDTRFDAAFTEKLKQELLNKAVNLQNRPKFNLKINFNFMKKLPYVYGGLAAVALLVFGLILGRQTSPLLPGNTPSSGQSQTTYGNSKNGQGNGKIEEIKAFASKEEFLAYLQKAQQSAQGGGFGRGGGMADLAAPTAMETQKSAPPSPGGSLARVSQTNVQVLGIDEPDIVKTNGKEIFFSSERYFDIYEFQTEKSLPSPQAEEMFWPPQRYAPNTLVINALPVSELKTLGKIDRQGELLLHEKTLMVFSHEGIYGYDISAPENPKEKWKIKYENNSQLVSARQLGGKVYLVTRNFIGYDSPCPLKPLTWGETRVEIPCARIYHPIQPVPDAAAFNGFAIDPNTGEVKNKLAFVGSYGQSVIYMSPDYLYVTYTLPKDQLEVMVDFLKTSGKGILPAEISQKLEKLQGYDISGQAKLVEMQQILEKYYGALDLDSRRKLENQMQNRLADYLKAHKRELVSSGIVKINLDNFNISSIGSVPGTPLNQFSLDEYEGNLRIATTVGDGFWMWGFGGSGNESANDVYVLDKELKTAGSIVDLGLSERIYSARFVGDKGYLVTFRQTDPFYVLDLSNPKNPQKKGELKIPGFSSYLHPLDKNLILGVGLEGWKVKLSLFDVSDPASPKELDKYNLDEGWSEVSNNHHAFLQDAKHAVFFLPGGESGYIFSYKNGRLNLEKAVSKIQAKRALNINDYLYIIGDGKIAVLDEKTWDKVKEIDLK